jgi:hypothetical protein
LLKNSHATSVGLGSEAEDSNHGEPGATSGE